MKLGNIDFSKVLQVQDIPKIAKLKVFFKVFEIVNPKNWWELCFKPKPISKDIKVKKSLAYSHVKRFIAQ